MRVGALILLFTSVVLAVAVTSSVTSADNHVVYGCFLSNNEVFWDGYGHPAAFEGFGGPAALVAKLGSECDEYPSRADYVGKRIWSPERNAVTPTPVPTATPTPTPTPVPTPEPEDGSQETNHPFCFWNDTETVLWCYDQ